MKCVSCGAEIEDNAQFCSECGAPVSPHAEKTPPLDPDKTHKMPAAMSVETAAEMPSVDKASLHDQPTQFAPPVAATRVASSDQSATKKGLSQNAKLGIIIGVAAAVVIVCGIIIAVLIMSNSAQQTETETTTQTQVEQQEQTTTQERA